MDFKKLIIIGAGGHGRVVQDVALSMGKWDEILFLDEGVKENGFDMKTIGKPEDAFSYIKEADVFVAIGDNNKRKKMVLDLLKKGASVPALIHKSAVLGKDVTAERGSVIMAGVAVNCNSVIGKGAIINTGVTLDHDNIIGDFSHISPGATLAGTVKIGEGSWIGTGSSLINNIEITEGCIIGAGSVVIRDIKEPGTYVGVPAKKIK